MAVWALAQTASSARVGAYAEQLAERETDAAVRAEWRCAATPPAIGQNE
jgi:hypothetical protein